MSEELAKLWLRLILKVIGLIYDHVTSHIKYEDTSSEQFQREMMLQQQDISILMSEVQKNIYERW